MGGKVAVFEDGRIRPSLLRRAPWYYVGVDLGQSQDYTAIAVVERADLVHAERDPVTWEFVTETRFHVRHVERVPLGSPYPAVAQHVAEMVQREPLAGHVTVVVDGTGVGAPVVDLLRRGGIGCRVLPVVITGGNAESRANGRYSVPKRDLMGGLQVGLQKRRLRLAARVKGLEALVEELRGMRLWTGRDGGERYGGRRHDDLVLALALAWWWASREAGVV